MARRRSEHSFETFTWAAGLAAITKRIGIFRATCRSCTRSASRTTLKLRLASGKALPALWLATGALPVVEAAVRSKPGVIVLDLQHGLFDRPMLEAAIGIVPPDIPVMVRVAENTAIAIGEALDAGAEGVIVPLVETAKQSRRAVSAASCCSPQSRVSSRAAARACAMRASRPF